MRFENEQTMLQLFSEMKKKKKKTLNKTTTQTHMRKHTQMCAYGNFNWLDFFFFKIFCCV